MHTKEVNEKKAQVMPRVSPNAAFIARVRAVKPKLPANYKAIILSNYSEYNTAKGSILIQNVVALRTADVVLTEILEKVAKGDLQLKDNS